MGEPARGGPARNYSWPPFEPGNLAALKSGADSPRMVQPLANELAAQVVDAAPWCGHAAFAAEVAAWAWEEARVRLLQAWINERGLLAEESAGALSQLERAQGRAARLRQNLGLNPVAWSKVLASAATAKAAGVEAAGEQVEALAAVGRELTERASLPAGEEASDGEA